MCGGGGGQLIYIVSPKSPYRYVNIQSVFWRRMFKAVFGLLSLSFLMSSADVENFPKLVCSIKPPFDGPK